MIEEKLLSMGFNLDAGPGPLAMYIPAVKSGNLVFTAGQLPMADGKLKFSGKVGKEVSIEEGKQAAEICAVNCLRVIKNLIHELDKIERIIKLTVFVNSAEGFFDQPKVANGASELLVNLFGENGKHVRSAVGVNELPLNAPVEIEMIIELKGL